MGSEMCIRDRDKGYSPSEERITDEEIEQVLHYHTDLGGFDDDVFIIGETERCWWVAHCACAVSDCAAGRIAKSIVTLDTLVEAVKEYFDAEAAPDRWPIRAELDVKEINGHVKFF